MRLFIHGLVGIIFSACSPAIAQNLDHSLGPIKQAQETDPAGFGLMVFCICLLVLMVLGLFGGTIFYFVQDKKKRQNRAMGKDTAASTVPTEQE